MQGLDGPVGALWELIYRGRREWCSSMDAESVVFTAVALVPTTVPEIQLTLDIYWLHE